MIPGWSPYATLLLAVQQVGTLPDTIVTRQIVEDPGLLQRFVLVAQALMTVAVLVLAIALIPTIWNLRKSYRRVNTLLDRLYGDVHPIMHHASSVADNLNYVTTSLRQDVQQVNRTVASANQRVQQASRLAERRLHELTALLDVVQEEAEDTFIAAAATVRGMRTGADRLGEELSAGARAARLDDLELPGDHALDYAIDIEEEHHGEHPGDDPRQDAEVPRVRPRRRA